MQSGLTEVRSLARREAEDGMKLQVAENDETISSMQKKIEEVKQKAEQGSQQLQGEVQELELELENLLRSKFPFDVVEPVPKGEFGGDALQRVNSGSGTPCGSILWEFKRTKSDGWLAKLREDQRSAKAEVCVLVSQVLPKGVEAFDLMDGVGVASPRVVIRVAMMLRQGLQCPSA